MLGKLKKLGLVTAVASMVGLSYTAYATTLFSDSFEKQQPKVIGKATVKNEVIIVDKAAIESLATSIKIADKIEGDETLGEMIIDTESIPADWQKDKIILLPPEMTDNQGLALKILEITKSNGQTKIKYTIPEIDELLTDASIHIDTQITPDMIVPGTYQARKGVQLMTRRSSSADVKWLSNINNLVLDTAVDSDKGVTKGSFKFGLNNVKIFEKKDPTTGAKGALIFNGSLALKNMVFKYDYQFKGIQDPHSFYTNASFDYDYERLVTITGNTGISASLANLKINANGYNDPNVSVRDKAFRCGHTINAKVNLGNSASVDTTLKGATWNKDDVCLLTVIVNPNGVIQLSSFKQQQVALPIALEISLFVNAKMELKIAATVKLNKTSHKRYEGGLDLRENAPRMIYFDREEYDKLVYDETGKKVPPTWYKEFEGKINGTAHMYIGVAPSIYIAGINPLVVRAFAGPELKASATGEYNNVGGLDGCYDIKAGLGYGATLDLGISGKLESKVNILGFEKKIKAGSGVNFNYTFKDQLNFFDANNCLPNNFELYYSKAASSNGTTFYDMRLFHNPVGAASIKVEPVEQTWTLYNSSGQQVAHSKGNSWEAGKLVAVVPEGDYTLDISAKLPSQFIKNDKETVRKIEKVKISYNTMTLAQSYMLIAPDIVATNTPFNVGFTLYGDEQCIITQNVYANGSSRLSFPKPGTGCVDITEQKEFTIDTAGTYTIKGMLESTTGEKAEFSREITVIGSTATKLNDTGITKCATEYGGAGNSQNCSAVQDINGKQIPAGQDGHYGTGKNGSKGMFFEKVVGYEDKCVLDKHTGLMWEVKQDSGTHGWHNLYAWYSTTNNNGNAGTQGLCSNRACDTAAFVSEVNNGAGWCGYTDWRLPTRRELRSIIDYSHYDVAVDASYFPRTWNQYYWSSSPASGENNDYAWVISFMTGNAYSRNKNNFLPVRLVRNAVNN